MDEILTRFTADHPCWTQELLLLAGEDSTRLEAGLAALAQNGLLQNAGDVYWLTEAGKARFAELARECYLDERPGDKPADPARHLAITRMWLNLERCNRQLGGSKDYRVDLKIPVRPRANPSYILEGDRLRWIWPDDPAFGAMKNEFPPANIDTRRVDAVPAAKLQAWQEKLPADAAPLRADLLLLAHYDMVHYLDFSGHPNDIHKLINTDRFCFVLTGNLENALETTGKYQRWLYELRHVAIPGYLDVDTQQQDSANWLVLVTETEDQALKLAREMAVFGEDLTRPGAPMELWALSLEALNAAQPGRDVIWELLPFIAHAIWPPRLKQSGAIQE